MTTRIDADAEVVAAVWSRRLDLAAPLGDEYRYAHLSLCVLDAVFSIGVRYAALNRVLLIAPTSVLTAAETLNELLARVEERDQPWTEEWREARAMLVKVSRETVGPATPGDE
jgi:hypothetical protein